MDSLDVFKNQWLTIITVAISIFSIIIVLKVLEARTAKVSIKPIISENFRTVLSQNKNKNEEINDTYITPGGKDTDLNYYINK